MEVAGWGKRRRMIHYPPITPVFLSGQASPALHRPGRAALSGGF